MSWVPLSNNRWGLDINYLPVTIGVADDVYYEEIYATVEDFKATWGEMDNNYRVYFSNQDDYIPADDPIWNDYNQDPVYTFLVTAQGFYGTTGAYGELQYKGDTYPTPDPLKDLRHYPALLDLGGYTRTFQNIGNGYE